MRYIPVEKESPAEDLNIALEAAQRAAELLRIAFYKKQDIREKGVGDLYSQVDIDADKAVQNYLQKMRPKDNILSEELLHSTKETGERLWIIDPLDATSAYLFGIGDQTFSVMIALREEFETKLSVIFFPETKNCYYAIQGKGAYKNGEKLDTIEYQAPLKESWVDLNQYGNAAFETILFRHLREQLRSNRGARLVTSLAPHSGIAVKITEQVPKLGAVLHDNNAKKPKQAPWDIIPAKLILEEAGGYICNLTGEAIDPFLPEPYIMAANKSLAEEILGLLK